MLKQVLFFSKIFLLLWATPLLAVPWLGISFSKQTYPDHLELLVRGIHPQSGAVNSGIVDGDIIEKIDGKIIVNGKMLKEIFQNKKTGDKVLITYRRNKKSYETKVMMTERPDDISSLMGSAIGSKALDLEKNFYANVEKRKSKPKVTLLDFWATWCGPCRNTLPMLDRLYKNYSSQGLEITGVSSEVKSTLEKFQQKFPAPYPLYQDVGQKLWSHYGIRSVPTLMLLDENGYILKVWHGVRSEKDLEAAVKNALGL